MLAQFGLSSSSGGTKSRSCRPTLLAGVAEREKKNALSILYCCIFLSFGKLVPVFVVSYFGSKSESSFWSIIPLYLSTWKGNFLFTSQVRSGPYLDMRRHWPLGCCFRTRLFFFFFCFGLCATSTSSIMFSECTHGRESKT
ncbi:MAG: hypothetical protein BYD32DRAFT_270348 [Podila humilis]|nr:MAG: hypothetical protein BYD32DRAFT_270348 [Podila humilis]